MRRVGFWGAGSEREGDSLASESLPELWQCYMYSPNATHPHRIVLYFEFSEGNHFIFIF